MKRLWVAAALAPLSFAAMAHAQTTTISGSQTTPVTTTVSEPNVDIESGGTINPSAGPAAVTVAVPGNITNAGSITFANVSGATGILINGDVGSAVSTIDNTGTISLTETTTGDGTNQSITKGPFANGDNRFGIDVAGSGTFAGSITNSGTITIVGENSAGIAIGSGMTGDLTESGTITVTGGTPTYSGTAAGTDNKSTVVNNAGNVTYGINATGAIGGNVALGGTIGATGQNAVGAALSGGVGGGVTLDGTITATGYRSTTAPTDPTVLANLTGDQTLQGGPALEIGGNVGAGVTIDAAVAASGNVAAVPEGVLTVYGSAPALLIGGAGDITVGANADGFSLEIGGAVTAGGAYPDVSATAIQIGGVNNLPVQSSGVTSGGLFGAVTLANGVDVTGNVTATSESHTPGSGDATGILVGSTGNVSALTITGNVTASAISDALVTLKNAATSEISVTNPIKLVPITVSGITVAQGGSLTTITNSGVISAAIGGIPNAANYTAAGGLEGQAVAINDQSGTGSVSVVNTNAITASITPIAAGKTPNASYSDIVAIYLANVGDSASVTQNANGNTSIIPTITGEVIFGNTTLAAGNATVATTIIGSESLDLEAGVLNGNVAFNGVGNNSLTINGGATLTGALSQAGNLTVGSQTFPGALTIDVNNGTLDMTAPTANSLGGPQATINSPSLTIGSKGAVIFTIDPTQTYPTNGQINVTGTAELDPGSKIGASLTAKLSQAQTYTFTLIQAQSLSFGTGNASGVNASLLGQLPYLYAGSIAVDTTTNQVNISIVSKTAKELDLNPAQSAALNAIYSQMSTDTPVVDDVLAQTTRSGFLHIYNQFLPDYAGGVFESIADGQRALARAEAEAPVKLQTDQTRGWVQEIGYLATRDNNALSNGYQADGFGFAGGIEHARGDSAIGVTGAILTSAVNNGAQTSDGSQSSLAIEGGLYWRAGGEGLNANASVNGGYVSLGSHRLLLDQSAAGAVTLYRDASSQWSGAVGSAQFGVSYQVTMGRFYMRPEASADYVALYETAHTEHGGGPALDLGINSRLNTEASAEGDLVFGYSFGDALRLRPELTVGYREILYGGPASTTARFLSGGSSFTLTPDLTDRGGFLARLGLRASGTYADITADAGGEIRNGYQTYDARAVARFLF